MSTLIFSPYGTSSQESGILYLLASYMNAQGLPVFRAACNGIVSVCDRDREGGWQRGVHTCMDCMSDARNLQKWSQVSSVDLSRFIVPEEIERTRRWVLKLDAENLASAEFDGVRLFELCEGTFADRFSVSAPEPGLSQHERFARRVLLSAARMKLISRRMLRSEEYSNCFIAGGKEYLSAVFKSEAERFKIPVAAFSWRSGSRVIDITSAFQETYQCEVLLDSVANMRQDVRSWPDELIAMLDELLGYLGVVSSESVVGIAS